MALGIQVDLDLQDNQLDNLDSLATKAVYFGTRSTEPTDAEYDSDEIALYFKDDENLYKRPHGGSESGVGSGSSGGKSTEEIEDIVANLVVGGNNVSVNYDDANDTLTISSSDTTLTNEEVQDVVAGLLVGGTNIDITYDDVNDELTIDASGSSSDSRTDVSDTGGVVVSDTGDITFTSSSDASVSVTDDGDNTATVDYDVTDTNLSDEQVEDIVAALVTGGSDISVTYDDAGGSLAIDYTGSSGSGDSTRSATIPLSELETGSVISTGVPVSNNTSLDIMKWGTRTSSNTTPNGLRVQLTEPDGTVIQEESTALTQGSPVVSTTNSSGSTKWYRLRVSNETGTNYVSGATPNGVFGTFEYQIN